MSRKDIRVENFKVLKIANEIDLNNPSTKDNTHFPN